MSTLQKCLYPLTFSEVKETFTKTFVDLETTYLLYEFSLCYNYKGFNVCGSNTSKDTRLPTNL